MKKFISIITLLFFFVNIIGFESASALSAGNMTDQKLPAHPFDINVEPYSGILAITQNDVVFELNPLPLGITRIFRGDFILYGEYGRGWTHNYDYVAEISDTMRNVAVYGPEGSEMLFKLVSGNKYEIENSNIYMVREENNLVMVAGPNEKYYFSFEGILEKVENIYAQALTFEYSGGNITRVSGPLGEYLEFAYNESDLVAAVSSSRGDRITYEYDDENRLSKVFVDGVLNEEYRYDTNGNLSEAELAGGFTWKIVSDMPGRVQSFTGPFKYTHQYEYSEMSGVKEYVKIEPTGARTVYRYDPNENTETVAGPEGGITVTKLDPVMGLVRSVTDPNGNVTEYKYDDGRNLVEISLPDGGRVVMEYLKDMPLPARVESPGGDVTTVKYDKFLNVVEMNNPAEGIKQFKYDRLGRLTYMRDADGSVTELKYGNGWDPISFSIDSGTEVKYDYDKNGRLKGTDSTVDGYMSSAELDAMIDKAIIENVPKDDFSKAGSSIKSKDGLSSYIFDKVGNIVSVSLSGGMTCNMEYDLSGRLTRKSADGRMLWEQGYDPSGNIVSKKFSDGSVSNFRYDSLNRFSGATYPDGSRSQVVYDMSGNIIRSQNGDLQKLYSYDASGKLLSSDISADGMSPQARERSKVSYAYKRGWRGSSTVEVSHYADRISYVYEDKEQLVRIESNKLGKFIYGYDQDGRLTSITYPNGIIQSYDLGNFKKQKIEVTRKGKVLRSVVLERDESDITVARTIDSGKEAYKYDERGQIVSAKTPFGTFAYEYDNWGNRLSESINGDVLKYSYLPDASLAARQEAEYSWDGRGNLIKKKTSEGETTFTFNYKDQLVGIRGPDGKSVSYEYGDQGLMASRTYGGETVYYSYMGMNPLAELDKDGNVIRYYVYGPSIDHILGMVEGEENYYFHRDDRNDVTMVTDKNGDVAASYSYDPFGNIVSKTGEIYNPFLFAGQRYELDPGLYYMRSRFYDPVAGRFISQDPLPGDIDDALSMNPYLYVKNSPIDHLDPLGLEGFSKWVTGAYNKAKGYVGKAVNTVKALPGNVKQAVGEYTKNMSISGITAGITNAVEDKLVQIAFYGKDMAKYGPNPTRVCQGLARGLGSVLSAAVFAYESHDVTNKVEKGEMSVAEGRKSILSNMTGAMASGVIGLAGTAVAVASLPAFVAVASVAIVGGVAVKKVTEYALENKTAQKVLEAPSMVTAAKKMTVKAVKDAIGGKTEAGKGASQALADAAAKHNLKGTAAAQVKNMKDKVDAAVEKGEKQEASAKTEKKEGTKKETSAKKEAAKKEVEKKETTETQTAARKTEKAGKEKTEAQKEKGEGPQTEPGTAAKVKAGTKASQLASKVDALLGKTSTEASAPEKPDVNGHIKAMKQGEGSVEGMIEKSDGFLKQYLGATGFGEFSGIIPNWDGGITTVDVPTYEEIMKWQQEAQAIAAAAAIIGAAVAAGIAASQQEKSSGGGGGGESQPQQYQKSQPACGPC